MAADQQPCAATAAEAEIIGSRSNDTGGDGTRRSAMDPPRCSAARRVSFHLLVPSLVITLFWLWSRTDQPWLAVSGISLLMCCYMHFWIISLSSHAMGVADFLDRIFCTMLLAFLVNCAVTPFAGMAALYFATVHAAGSLGYAIAEHRRRRSGSDDDDDEIMFDNPRMTKKRTPPPIISMSILSLLCALRVLWVACTYAPGDAAVAIVEFSLVTIGCLYLWMCIVHVWLLHSAFLSGDCLTSLFCSGVMAFLPVSSVVDNLFGDPGFVCLTWLTVMAIAGCLGYTFAIYHRYQQRLRVRSASLLCVVLLLLSQCFPLTNQPCKSAETALHHDIGRTELLPKGKNEQCEGAEEEQQAESDKPKPLEGPEEDEAKEIMHGKIETRSSLCPK